MAVINPGELSQKDDERASSKELKFGRLGEERETRCKQSFSAPSNNEPPYPLSLVPFTVV